MHENHTSDAATRAQTSEHWLWTQWIVVAITLFYLHYTTFIAIAGAVTFLSCILLLQPADNTRLNTHFAIPAFVVLLVAMIPGLWQLALLSNRSSQWAGFAGDSSWSSLTNVLPWFSLTLLPACGTLFVYVSKRRNKAPQIKITCLHGSFFYCFIWIWTLMVTWLLTALNIAPLMHTRYLWVVYGPLIITFAVLLQTLLQPGPFKSTFAYAILVIAGSLFTLTYRQGTLGEWFQGNWVAWQRYEGWNEAFCTLARNVEPNDVIALAPMLIETASNESLRNYPADYLRFAWTASIQQKSIRRQFDDRQTSTPTDESITILENDPETWMIPIERLANSLESSEADYDRKSIWIVARISRQEPANRRTLDMLESRWSHGNSQRLIQTFSYGNVQLIRIALPLLQR